MIDLTSGKMPASILIIRYYALGDIVLSFPLVKAMRMTFPDSHIDFLCLDRFVEALDGFDPVDDVIGMDGSTAGRIRTVLALRRKKYDLVIDLLSSPGSSLITKMSGAAIRIGMDTGRNNWCFDHLLPRGVIRGGKQVKCYTFDSNLESGRLLGVVNEDPIEVYDRGSRSGRYAIGFTAADRHRDWARKYLSGLGTEKNGFAGLVVGAKYTEKSWPEDYFVELARSIYSELGMLPIIIWGPGEEMLASRVAGSCEAAEIIPEMGIGRLGALIGELSVLAGIDSGPKHIAVLEGVPTVTLFGPTDPQTWDPLTDMHRALSVNDDCPTRDHDDGAIVGLSRIKPNEVLDEIREVLGAGEKEGSDEGRTNE
jgi:ADP-heptose:LPS heptosyltransferase